ncbi:YiaA/YiaB family inner membrane protein [Peribacillus alkalitolerans]|uniref:YiaA/YiaB family inner membrane protein n=1 Tax=Peribacillus alkalitolerans TaxID=1550385 RepID=UPI0013D2ADBA|nr:YiaA/YiaB family inner membrane protein [Peribacillus alkalitolerans]
MYSQKHRRRNTTAFTVLAYFTLFAGVILFGIGLYNETSLELNEKGYYVAVMLLCIVGAILTQKVVRDNAEDDDIIKEQERELTIKVSSAEKNKPKSEGF